MHSQFIKRARSKPMLKENIPPWEFAAQKPFDEDQVQTALFMWVRIATKFGFVLANDPNFYGLQRNTVGLLPVPELDLLFAIPNGGSRDGHTAQILKQTGVKAGVSDMFLPVQRTKLMPILPAPNYENKHFAGLWLELKTTKPGAGPQDNQLDWQTKMRDKGYACEIVYGFEQARDCLMWYLS